MNKSVVLFGDLLERLSPVGGDSLIQAGSFEVRFTGGEANAGVSCARFGMDAYAVGRVPAHDIGEACLAYLRRYGLDTRHILRGGERLALFYSDPGFSVRPSKIIYDRKNSAFCGIEPGMFDWDGILAGKDWFHFTGTGPAMGEGPKAELLRALKKAKELGLTVSFDYNYRSRLWSLDEARRSLEELLPYVDLGIGSEDECRHVFGAAGPEGNAEMSGISGEERFALAGETAEDMVRKYGLRNQAIIISEDLPDGGFGWSGIIAGEGGTFRSGRYTVKALDRVGCGDAFSGGLIYGLCTGMDRAAALEFAVAASCLKQTYAGDFNLASRDEVFALMRGGGSRLSR